LRWFIRETCATEADQPVRGCDGLRGAEKEAERDSVMDGLSGRAVLPISFGTGLRFPPRPAMRLWTAMGKTGIGCVEQLDGMTSQLRN